ncbi:MAG: lipopolysaccharide assembly LapA domain-containing protein [Burkholderiales bacterium]|jgi:putative membrane protein
MRLLTWLFRLGLFLVMMGFALSNTDTATLRFFGIPEFEWRAPMVLFLFLFFAAGALVGVVATMPLVFRQRRHIGRLRRDADAATKAAAKAATDPAPSVDAARLPAGGAGPRGI